MSQVCTIPICKYKSSTLCYCCNKILCVDHLNEHNDLNKSGLNSLHNETITLAEQFIAVDIDKLIKSNREKLDQWKENCQKIIDSYYEQKCQELEQFCTLKISQQRKELDQIQTTIIVIPEYQKRNRICSAFAHLDVFSLGSRT
jgi:tRNA uridine 5-carbamoylmethylation protein Kti12